jgi:hypothetical protein
MHAYCLIGDHYHLVWKRRMTICPGHASAQWRVHPDEQSSLSPQWPSVPGRYNAILVGRDSCLLELTRCVVLNSARWRCAAGVGAEPIGKHLNRLLLSALMSGAGWSADQSGK